ncbi:MAG: DUF6152 family protein [Pseudomonadales bacterium]|nr:DUF6152 family protein [Pseudomonadales bacterium]
MKKSIPSRFMSKSLLPAAALTAVFSASAPVSAHHGTAVSYDQDNTITVVGTVTEFRWRNPHSALFLETLDENGTVGHYTIELASPVLMSRSSGWTRATFKPGDHVEFTVHPSRTEAPVGECLFNCIVLVNGKRLEAQVQPQ